MKKVLFAFFTLIALGGNAQDFEWARKISGNNFEFVGTMAHDAAGNLYTLGSFTGTVDFDPSAAVVSLTSNGSNDIYLQKLDANGNFQWVKRMGSSGSDTGGSLLLDSSGNIYASGSFNGTVDFNPNAGTFNLVSSGQRDGWLQKLDPSGNFLWAIKVGGMGSDGINTLTLDAAQNIILSGSFNNTVDFDPGPATFNQTSGGQADAFLLKLNSSGGFMWARTFGGSLNVFGVSLDHDAAGNLYLQGAYNGTADFDPSAATVNLTAGGGSDIFVEKFDASGNFVWVKSMGSASFSDQAHRLTVGPNGGIYSCGSFIGTADFDPGPAVFNLTGNGSNDIFLHKLDSNGNFVWATSMGGPTEDEAYDVVTDPFGYVYFTGYFSGTTDFDPSAATFNLTAGGANDIFILKLDGNANFVWAEKFGAGASDIGEGLTIAPDGAIYAGGRFASTTDFDPGPGTANLTPSGSWDVYQLKLSQCLPTTSTAAVTACNSYTWNNNTYTSSGTYRDTIPNAGGCDSLLTLNLTINGATSSTQTATACNSYTWNNNTYTVSGTYQDTLMNANGCDSLLTLNLTINGATSSTQTTSACNSYTWNNNTYSVSGTYQDTLMNANGCDSILTLNLTINGATSSTQTINACDSYAWNGNIFTTSGTYQDTLMNANGCDSLLTLNLTVTSLDTSVSFTSGSTLMSNAAGAGYQWIDCTTQMPVPGATNQSFTATASGSYAVIVTQNGCSDTSACQAVTITSIGPAAQEAIRLSPNPTSGQLRVDLGRHMQEVAIRLYDPLGRLVARRQFHQVPGFTMEIPGARGIYRLEVLTDSGTRIVRGVVKK